MNPRVVGANLIVSLKCFYREKASVFFTIFFPIILILLFGAIFMNADNMTFDLQVQDLDHTNASANLIKSLELNGTFSITTIDPNVNATQYAKDNKVDLVVVIPKGYEQNITQRIAFKNLCASTTIHYIYDPTSSSASTKIQILNSAFGGMNQGLSRQPPFYLSTQSSILTKKYRYIEFFVPGIIAMSVMTSSLFGTVNMNAELRQKGVIRKLSTTPITRAEWILSNIMYQLVLAVISTFAILIIAYLAFNVSLQINGWLAVFVLLDVFAFAGIAMILTRFAKEAESAYAAAQGVMFPMMFLSGTFFTLDMMPSFLRVIAQFLPLYYVNEGLRAGMVYQDNVSSIIYAAIIGVFALIVFIIGIIVTKWEEGK